MTGHHHVQDHRQRLERSEPAVLLLCLALAAGLVAGCSSQSSSAASTSTPVGAFPSASSKTASQDTAAPTPSAPTATDATASYPEICKAISDSLSVLTSAATSPDDPTLQQGVDRIRQLAAQAPPDIKGDLTVIADFDQNVVDQVHSGKAPEITETPELTAAMSHEATWTATHCQAT